MTTDITLWTALITPMHEDGEVNHDELASLIHLQDDAGNGVLLLGSTGEGLALDDEEKRQVIKTATNLNIDVPIMAGVGGFNLRNQIEWIEFCNEAGVDSFLLVNPLYSKPGPNGQTEWFRALLDTADKPCMIYNIPSRTGVKLHEEVLQALENHPALFGVKEASGSIEAFRRYRQTAPGLKFYSGDDALTPFFAVIGCEGLVSVASNVWPEAVHVYVDRCLSGQTHRLLDTWKEPAEVLFSAPNPIPVKILLREKGIIGHSTLRPPLTEAELSNIDILKEADKAIGHWYSEISKTGQIKTR